MMDEVEKVFLCPHCWQQISIVISLLEPGQEMIEDCQICCNPIQINYTLAEDDEGEMDVASFVAETAD